MSPGLFWLFVTFYLFYFGLNGARGQLFEDGKSLRSTGTQTHGGGHGGSSYGTGKNSYNHHLEKLINFYRHLPQQYHNSNPHESNSKDQGQLGHEETGHYGQNNDIEPVKNDPYMYEMDNHFDREPEDEGQSHYGGHSLETVYELASRAISASRASQAIAADVGAGHYGGHGQRSNNEERHSLPHMDSYTTIEDY